MRPITDVLREIRKGRAVDLASRQLAEVVRAVEETGKPGEVTITLKVKPDEETGVLKLSPSVKCKVPQPDIGEAVFFAATDGSGDLLRTDPRQKEMFSEAGERQAGNA